MVGGLVGGVGAGQWPSSPASSSFTSAYVGSIWPALVVALLASAAVSTLVPPGLAGTAALPAQRDGNALVGGLVAGTVGRAVVAGGL